jgi:mono/diheme cytochrome c family protein
MMARALVLCLALATSAACAEPPATEPVARGRQVYRALDCGKCHQIAGDGSRIGPDLTRAGAVAEARQPADPAGYLRGSVTDPGAYVVPGFTDTMPRGLVRGLTAGDLDALLAFLASLR